MNVFSQMSGISQSWGQSSLNRYDGHGQWAQYHPQCPCATCQNLRAFSNIAQDYANRLDSKNNNRSREMTAADLGLIYVGAPFEYICIHGDKWARTDAFKADAPYSFWLGANA